MVEGCFFVLCVFVSLTNSLDRRYPLHFPLFSNPIYMSNQLLVSPFRSGFVVF